jgi:tetratricopeptide (TPR) repeat protein
MSRWVPLVLLACLAPLGAQQTAPPAPPQKPGELKERKPAATSDKEEVPPEEDTALAKDDFSFNPLQAAKEIEAGNYYFKKGSFLAAAGRYKNATRFNEGNSEAWLKLGEASEKLKDRRQAHEAYAKYLEVSPEAKNAAEIRKKLAKLK